MRRVVVLALLALALPIAAWADGIEMTNLGGTVCFCGGVLTSQGSHLHTFNGITASSGHALGSVSFQTGALISGTFFGPGGATFSSVGSSFDIIGQGKWDGHKWGNGTAIFSGAFVGNIAWNFVGTGPGHDKDYQLVGDIQGQLWNGRIITGSTTQNIAILSNRQGAVGIGHIGTGSTQLNTTPEPGTLGLLGTGLVGIAGMARRKMKA